MSLLTRNERLRIRYAQDPEYREKTLAAVRKRYAEDDGFRESSLAAKRQRYAEDPQYRETVKGQRVFVVSARRPRRSFCSAPRESPCPTPKGRSGANTG